MQVWARSGVFMALCFAVSANTPTPHDFTGHWGQQTNAGERRQLDIEQDGNTLRVETTITNSKGTRHLAVTYQIGGRETVFKGLDGDQFYTRVHLDGGALVFETIEHEGGRRIPEKTVWTLSDDHLSLRVKRQSKKSGKDSSVTYTRQR